MSQALTTATPQKASALAVMASRFNVEPNKMLDTLKGTVFKDARNIEELMALVIVANEYNLNPLTKEIYAFPAKGGGIVPVISIDGWANLANSHPQMDGMDFDWEHGQDGKLISCTCIIHRKDRKHPVKVTEYLSECKRNTEPWKMEHRMLRHKALSQCVRVAFGFSGIRDDDEANDIRDVTPPPAAPLFPPVQAEPQLLNVPATPLLTQVRDWMAKTGIDESRVLLWLNDQGEDLQSLEQAEPAVLSSVINSRSIIEKEAQA